MGWDTFILGIVGSIIAAEIYLWFPHFAKRIITYHAARLPSELSDRMLEEWSANLEDIPTNFGKLIFALDLYRAVPCILHQFYFPSSSYKVSLVLGKRLFDVFFGSFLLIFMLPLLSIISLALRFEKQRPILDYKVSVGLTGRKFNLIKFRSDSKLGCFFNRMGYRGYPMLFNIIKNDISFFDPDPIRKKWFEHGNQSD